MPRGGYNRKSRRRHFLQGTLRADHVVDGHPKPPPIAPRVPAGLSPRARAMWESLAPILERRGLLTPLDGSAFQMLCEIGARLEEARLRLRVVEQQTTDPGLIRLAEISVAHAESSWRQLAAEFGLTPRSRTRLDVAPLPSIQESELDVLMGESREGRDDL